MDTPTLSAFAPSEAVRSETEAMTLGFLNKLMLSRASSQRRHEGCLAAGDVMEALGAARDVRFLEGVYRQTLDLLRLVVPKHKGAIQ